MALRSALLLGCLLGASVAFSPATMGSAARFKGCSYGKGALCSPRPRPASVLVLLRAEAGKAGDEEAKEEERPHWLMRFRPPKVDRQQLAALGASAMLSYGMVSNVNMGICMMLAWATFGKSTGLSPLDAGQWPKFLAVYGGYWVAANFLRPFRIALAMAIAPAFDKLVMFWQNTFKISRAAAFGTTVFFVNVLGNLAFLFGGLMITTSVLNLPLFPTQSNPPAAVRAK